MTRTIPSLILLAGAAAVIGGCAARDTAGLPDGSISTGGVLLEPYYCEVVYQKEGDAKPRVYLFGSVAAVNHFAKEREVSETGHLKRIGGGKNRETLIVETSKSVPELADRLVAQYRRRHGLPPLPSK